MTAFQIKEANMLYWMVKGQLIPEGWNEKDVKAIYESYFKRVWGNHEAGIHKEGFEVAWKAREAQEINKVAILGYN